MSKDLPQPKQSEEVDLSQLFKLIGNAFNRLFNFIGSTLKSLFNFVILFLLFIRKYFVKIVVIVIVGFVIGIFTDIVEGPKYISTMLVEPNFNSVEQLYKNMHVYNELVQAKDSVALSEILGISKKEARSLKEFKVNAYADKNQKLKLFDNFVKDLDTITVKSTNPEKFLNNFNTLSLRFHLLTVTATDNSVAKKIEPVIIEAIKRNVYFNQQKEINNINIALKTSFYTKQLAEIDSLQTLYKNIMLKQVDRPVAGTNISLGDNVNKENKEFILINKKEEIQSKVLELNIMRVNKLDIINVISDFPDKGLKDLQVLKSYKFRIPALLLTLSLLFFGLFSLNNYLNAYQEKS